MPLTLHHEAMDLNPAGGRIQPMTVGHFFVQNLSLSPFRFLDMTYIMVKGRQNTKSSSSPYTSSLAKFFFFFLHEGLLVLDD